MSDFCFTPSEYFFQLYHGWREHVTFRWDNDVLFALDQHALLDYFIVLAH